MDAKRRGQGENLLLHGSLQVQKSVMILQIEGFWGNLRYKANFLLAQRSLGQGKQNQFMHIQGPPLHKDLARNFKPRPWVPLNVISKYISDRAER